MDEPSNTDVDVTRVEPTGQDHGDAAGGPGKAVPSLARGAEVGRYVIIDELGAGGMGEVFAAWDPELGRRIALKLVKLSQREKAHDARNRLLREAQALAKLSHPNVVAIYDVGTHGDRVFLAMEHVEGQTMAAFIEKAEASAGGPARWREGLSLMLQAGRGLAAAHVEGLVHRDFKPANIMVSADGRVRVLDFGLARRYGDEDPEPSGGHPIELVSDAIDISGALLSGSYSSRDSLRMQLTQAGMVMGTPAYMAPEQFCGGHIDARTDQFAFCIVLWRVLFGQRPFEGDTFQALGRAVVRGDLREPPKRAGLPRAVRLALRRGLSVSREERFPTMDALLDQLEHALGQGRRRLGWAVAGALVLTAGAVGAMRLGAPAPEAPCQGASAKLEGVWDDAVRTAVTEAFARTALPYADDVRTAAARSLDAYAERWVELRTATCEATRVRGDQSEALMDLRIGCLDAKLRDVGALTEVLANADADVVKHAAQATQALPSPDECATLERETAALLQPADPTLAAEVEAVREQLSRVRAASLAGKYDDGLALAEPAAEAARKTGYRAVIAEASYLLGELNERKLVAAAARDGYEDALYAAIASGHAHFEARALIGLLSVWGMHLNDTETALRYGQQAEAVIERLGHPRELDAALALYRGNTLMAASRLEDALEQMQQAVRLSDGVAIAERTHLAALNNLAVAHGQQGRYREATEAFTRSLELSEERLGKWHPVVGTNHLNLGVTYTRLEDHERGMAHTLRAIEIQTRSLGPDHPEIGRAYHNLGVTRSAAGNEQGAYDDYVKALEIKRRGLGPDHLSVALSANNVGDVLIRLGRPQEAIPYCEDALRIWTQAQGEQGSGNVYGLMSLSEAYLTMGRPAEALPHIRRAIAIAEQAEIDPVDRAKTQFVAARVLAGTGARKEALRFAEQAKQGYEASERPSLKEIAAVEALITTLR
jgi:eukaryotic-like serine/threonine-protein kinase